jgi:LysR family nitrogen assimilation transcriptional regulator
MDLKQLRAFLTVVETGNITRAASLLNLVQPAVSRQIRLLEESIGTPLFDRERRGMILTEAGEVLVGYARRALLELDRARVEISGSGQRISGLVTLGLLPSSIDLLSSPLTSALATTYPGIRVRLAMGYVGTLQRWLTSGEVDVALLYGTERSPEIQTEPLFEEPLWVIAPKDSALRADRPVALTDLAHQPLVLPSAPHGIRTLMDQACAASQVTLNVSVETNALSVQRSLVLGGHGWTILPPIAVADDLRKGQLCGAPLMEPVIMRTIVLAIPTNRPLSKAVQVTIDLLKEQVCQLVESGAWMQGRWLE